MQIPTSEHAVSTRRQVQGSLMRVRFRRGGAEENRSRELQMPFFMSSIITKSELQRRRGSCEASQTARSVRGVSVFFWTRKSSWQPRLLIIGAWPRVCPSHTHRPIAVERLQLLRRRLLTQGARISRTPSRIQCSPYFYTVSAFELGPIRGWSTSPGQTSTGRCGHLDIPALGATQGYKNSLPNAPANIKPTQERADHDRTFR